MQLWLFGQWQARQKGDVDASNIMAFNQNCRQVPCLSQVLRTQALQYADVLDFLQCQDIRSSPIVYLQNGRRDNRQLLVENFVVPVPVKALIPPALDSDLAAGSPVLLCLLGFNRQKSAIVFARIIAVVEKVFDVEGHDRNGGRACFRA